MPGSESSLPNTGQNLRQAFEALVETLNERGVSYAIIGGLAVVQHTRVRTTDDVDALLTVPKIAIPGLFEKLRERGFTVDLDRNVREFAASGYTSLRFADVLVDLLEPRTTTYTHILDRAVDAEILGRRVRISSAEGLILMKLMAMRPQDQADIQDLLRSYAGRLDMEFIRSELATFTTPDDSRWAKLEAWAREAMA